VPSEREPVASTTEMRFTTLVNRLSPHSKERSGGGLPATEVVRLSQGSPSGKGGAPSPPAASGEAGRGGIVCESAAKNGAVTSLAETVESNGDFWASVLVSVDNGHNVDTAAVRLVALPLNEATALESSGAEVCDWLVAVDVEKAANVASRDSPIGRTTGLDRIIELGGR